jgi:hypothetical protein
VLERKRILRHLRPRLPDENLVAAVEEGDVADDPPHPATARLEGESVRVGREPPRELIVLRRRPRDRGIDRAGEAGNVHVEAGGTVPQR